MLPSKYSINANCCHVSGFCQPTWASGDPSGPEIVHRLCVFTKEGIQREIGLGLVGVFIYKVSLDKWIFWTQLGPDRQHFYGVRDTVPPILPGYM